MGTRSLTHFIEKEEIFCTVYRQFDGYPSGHGKDIKNCLGGKEIVNGYQNRKTQINGIKSAAAMLIATVASPTETGSIYIERAGVSGVWEDYVYHISERGNGLHLKVDSFGGTIFDGPLNDFNPDMEEGEE